MSKQDTTTKLAATEASLKRWQTRLKRAATKVNELDRQRRRYQLTLLDGDKPVVAVVKVKKQTETDHIPEAAFIEAVKEAKLEKVASELAVPAFLDRADPHIAAKMTAARKAKEAEARKQMPLTGKAALDAIKKRK